MNESVLRPFKMLGITLKAFRERCQESLAEACGAVEIDLNELEDIESGCRRPSEDILMLLINHFGVDDNEAVQLWQLAGYDKNGRNKSSDEALGAKQLFMVVALDSRVVYSDGVSINVDPSGVVMNFTQAGEASTRVPISRVGMSLAQAEVVAKLLSQALIKAKLSGGPKQLPPSGRTNRKASE